MNKNIKDKCLGNSNTPFLCSLVMTTLLWGCNDTTPRSSDTPDNTQATDALYQTKRLLI